MNTKLRKDLGIVVSIAIIVFGVVVYFVSLDKKTAKPVANAAVQQQQTALDEKTQKLFDEGRERLKEAFNRLNNLTEANKGTQKDLSTLKQGQAAHDDAINGINTRQKNILEQVDKILKELPKLVPMSRLETANKKLAASIEENNRLKEESAKANENFQAGAAA